MSWQLELIPASYQGFTFKTNDYRISQGKKGAIEEIANGNGAQGQDLGNTSKLLDIQVFFIGDNYKSERDAFELLLQIPLKIPGILLLPTRNIQFFVRPVSWVVNENPDKRGGRGDVTVQFREVLAEIGPLAEISQTIQIISAVVGAQTKIINDIVDNVDYTKTLFISQAQRDFTKYLGKLKKFIKPSVDPSLSAEFETQLAVLEENQNTLIDSDVEILASSYGNLISFPAKKITSFSDAQQNYELFIASVNSDFDETLTTLIKKNQAHQIEALTSFAFAAIVEAANNSKYDTKDKLSNALNNIKTNFEIIENNLNDLENLFDSEIATKQYRQSADTADSRNDLLARISDALLKTLFTLPNEKKIVLERSRSIVSLSFDLFGNVDDENIDNLIDNNSIIDPTLITAGTILRYYE